MGMFNIKELIKQMISFYLYKYFSYKNIGTAVYRAAKAHTKSIILRFFRQLTVLIIFGFVFYPFTQLVDFFFETKKFILRLFFGFDFSDHEDKSKNSKPSLFYRTISFLKKIITAPFRLIIRVCGIIYRLVRLILIFLKKRLVLIQSIYR